MSVADRLQDIRGRIASAARRAGRDPAQVTLIAACKRQPFERIRAAYDAGVRHFGENLAQGLSVSAERLAAEGKRDVVWHFIGRLQRNKVNSVLRWVARVHSVDRFDVAEAISARATQPCEVMIQVNLGREPSKGGVGPEEAVAFARRVALLPNLRVTGLMAIPPVDEPPAPYFAALRELSRELCLSDRLHDAGDLSIGMSDDFEIAIAHGATHVRLGTLLFGARDHGSQ